MHRSILVPLDDSAASEHVLPVAVQIAHNSGAALRLVLVPTPADANTLEGEASLDVALPARCGTRAEAYLEQIRERLTAGSNLTITADILGEPISRASATCAPVIDTDLVILATHRHSQLVRFQLRDITNALVRWRPALILALRTTGAALDSEPPELQRLLIPLDGSALAEQILAPALALGTSTEATYTLLHVVEHYRFVRGAAVQYTSRLDSPALVHEQSEAQDCLNDIALLMRAAGLHVQTQVAVACDARTAIWRAARQQEQRRVRHDNAHDKARTRRAEPPARGTVAVQVLRDSPPVPTARTGTGKLGTRHTCSGASLLSARVEYSYRNVWCTDTPDQCRPDGTVSNDDIIMGVRIMSKTKAKPQRAVVVSTIVYPQRPASAPELLPKENPEIAEVVEEVLDRVDEASWGSFPASDAPSWIPTQVGS